MWISKVTIIVLGAICAQSSANIIRIAPQTAGAATPNFHLNAKSDDIVARHGDTIDLTCQTTTKWQLCGWQLPTGDWCDRLSTTKYATSCDGLPRVRYERAMRNLDLHPEPSRDCSATIVDLQLEDEGAWTCMVKEELRSRQEYFETVRVTVAIPYILSLDPPNPVLMKNRPQNETISEIVCQAEGAGGVDPIITWKMNGNPVPADSSWIESKNSSSSKLIYSSLNIHDDMEDGTSIRCLAKQYFPNKTVIYESSVLTKLTVVEELQEPEKAGQKIQQGAGQIAGAVITGIVGVILFVALGLVCYAQRKKKWCYAKSAKHPNPESVTTTTNTDTANRPSNRSSLDEQTITADQNGPEEANLLNLNDDHDGDNDSGNAFYADTSPNDSSVVREVSPEESMPPSAPPIESESIFFPVHHCESTPRLQEMIEASPSGLPETRRRSFPRPSVISQSSVDSRLSEAVNSKRIRRQNDYVQSRPSLSASRSEVNINEEDDQEPMNDYMSSVDTLATNQGDTNVLASVDVHNEADSTSRISTPMEVDGLAIQSPRTIVFSETSF